MPGFIDLPCLTRNHRTPVDHVPWRSPPAGREHFEFQEPAMAFLDQRKKTGIARAPLIARLMPVVVCLLCSCHCATFFRPRPPRRRRRFGAPPCVKMTPATANLTRRSS
jgi:hypothetical protein